MREEYYFKDFLGRTTGPFPTKEIASQAYWDFNVWLWEDIWKQTHGGFLYR